MPQTEEDMHRFYQEKIKHIEDQIRHINEHIKDLDAFESVQMRRNLPKEYKTAMHFAMSKARHDADTVKGKADKALTDLKGKVNGYLQRHNYRRV